MILPGSTLREALFATQSRLPAALPVTTGSQPVLPGETAAKV